MKKLSTIFALFLILSLQACSKESTPEQAKAPSKWKEGTHYIVINETATEKPEVLEFFSFWCPHCYNYEPIVEQIKQKLDKDVNFKKVHVNFMRFTSAEIQDAATKALLVGRNMKQEQEMNSAIFSYIHLQRQPITGLSDLRNIFLAKGIETEEFDKVASSFQVNNLLKQNNQTIEKYRDHLSGVPNFIINGKYQAKVVQGMSREDIADLIVWLSKQR
ncbi:thiol:disulfide interchange protein DsbA/DsbL [Aliiglaciecola lipolytica]|uniref:Thiol:disulfide interchange protein DsbA n=1 Tax=Aliiglaciecola lipolytica E3 TaxID=1127673 RepID=K6YFM0_9ALTE|nr:thiol:disulfide interchange protein DsbA/DsbL [Aliiglaciecola lipolytica]GAC15418.1 thiol:disulfide interchange protein DsbA [Aliiglaciecola lipolytica E3]